MRLAPVRFVVAAVAAAFAATACGLGGPGDDLDDLISVMDGLVATTEADVPALAADLGATVTEAKVWHSSNGTDMAGTELKADLMVTVDLTGPPATQQELEQLLEDHGYKEVAGWPLGDDPAKPWAEGITVDGKTEVNVGYGVRYPNTEFEFTGFTMSLAPVNSPHVKRTDFNSYVDDYSWTIDTGRLNDAIDALK